MRKGKRTPFYSLRGVLERRVGGEEAPLLFHHLSPALDENLTLVVSLPSIFCLF